MDHSLVEKLEQMVAFCQSLMVDIKVASAMRNEETANVSRRKPKRKPGRKPGPKPGSGRRKPGRKSAVQVLLEKDKVMMGDSK